MWDKPQHRRIEGTARPLRVAYLVDLGDCPDSLLDEVFSECFSRWGGRRTTQYLENGEWQEGRLLALDVRLCGWVVSKADR